MTDSVYLMPAASPEKDRLTKQYIMKKSIYGWTSAVPDSIDLTRLQSVIDVGAGTCIWTLDLADTLKARGTNNTTQLYACDIEAKFLPSAELAAAAGITLFTQDVTKPFPEEYHGTFDLVHASLLFLCLTEEGWGKALLNFKKLLRAGGVILLEEADPILLTEEQELLRSPADDVLSKYLTGTTWMHKANCIYTGYALKNHFVVGIPYRLPAMLHEAGLAIESQVDGFAAIGKVCRLRTGLRGDSLVPFEGMSAEIMDFLFQYMARALAQKGNLEAPWGSPVGEEAMEAVLEEIRAGMVKEGAIIKGAHFVCKSAGDLDA
ncbi:S-adenosyl-L-methionine-dependent methyltransferase [Mycena filopes]|nr:S-adenosyl-L-methionine-dependent methyltransferase [Mycena filopes]